MPPCVMHVGGNKLGVNEFKYEFHLNIDLNTILSDVKVWLFSNGFKIKEEISEQNKIFINSCTGTNFFSSESEVKRWLEIHANYLPAGNYVVLYEKLSAWTVGAMKSDLIKDEVLSLAAFLQAGGIPSQSQQQQQQIIVNVAAPQVAQPVPQTQDTPIFCIQCGTRNQANAVFCKNCGATMEK